MEVSPARRLNSPLQMIKLEICGQVAPYSSMTANSLYGEKNFQTFTVRRMRFNADGFHFAGFWEKSFDKR